MFVISVVTVVTAKCCSRKRFLKQQHAHHASNQHHQATCNGCMSSIRGTSSNPGYSSIWGTSSIRGNSRNRGSSSIRGNSYSGQLVSSIRGNSRDRVGVGRAGRLRLLLLGCELFWVSLSFDSIHPPPIRPQINYLFEVRFVVGGGWWFIM